MFRNCVRTHIDVCFKEGKCRFICVENSCPGEYPMRLINELLPEKDLKRLNRRIQEENIRQGNTKQTNKSIRMTSMFFSFVLKLKSKVWNAVLTVHMLLLSIIPMIKSFVVSIPNV